MKLGVDSVEEDDENHDLADRDREAPARDEDPGQRCLDHEPGEQRGDARGTARTVVELRGPCVAGAPVERAIPRRAKGPQRGPPQMPETRAPPGPQPPPAPPTPRP